MIPKQLKGTLCGSISPLKRQKGVATLQKTSVILLLILSINLNAQTLLETNSQLPLYTTCSAIDNVEIQFYLGETLPPITTGTFKGYALELYEKLPSGSYSIFKRYTLGDYVNSGGQNGRFTITFNKNSIDIRDGILYNGNVPYKSGYKRKDITFHVKIYREIDNNRQLVRTNSNDFTLTAGIAPSFYYNNTLLLCSPGEKNIINIYRGSHDTVNHTGYPRIYKSGQSCSNNPYSIVIWEINRYTGDQIGQKYTQGFTNQNKLDFNNPSVGLPIWVFDNGLPYGQGNQSFWLQIGHSYTFGLIYTGEHSTKTTFSTIHYNWGIWDLAIKDNPTDVGEEPLGRWDDDVFRSPNLWNKLSTTSNQNNQIHENPDYVTVAGNTNKLMVNVSNISYAYSTNNIGLRMFWTRARTSEVWNSHWLYDMTNNVVLSPLTNTNVAAGSEITISGATLANPYNTNSSPFQLSQIQPGIDYTMPFSAGVNWFPPNPADFDVSNGSMSGGAIPIICLLARIQEKNSHKYTDPIRFQPTGLTDDILPYVKNNNNVATRNSWLVNSPQFRKRPASGGVGTGWHHDFGTVVVNNPKPTPVKVNLCVDILPVNGSVNNFNQHGFIEIGTTNGLYNQWLAGGSQVSNVVVQSPTLFKITNGTHACLNNITLPAGFQEQVGLRFQFINSLLPISPIEFTYQLSQSTMDTTLVLSHDILADTLGNIDTIIDVYTPKIHPIYGSNTVYIVNVPTAPPIGWENAQVTSIKNNTKVQNNLIVYPNPSNSNTSISMFNTNNTASTLTITNVQGVVIKTYHYNTEGAFIENIDTSLLANGIYTISFTNGKTTETQKLTVIH